MRTTQADPESLDPRQLLSVLTAVRKGDFTARMPEDLTGMAGKVADALNDVIEMNAALCAEMARVGHEVGKEGRTGQRAHVEGARGGWQQCLESVNTLISDLAQPTTEMSRVIGAVAQGDLSQKVDLTPDGRPLTGEFLRTARTVNTMVDQLNGFASEVIRVAREVGTEGKLGGQADVQGVSGTWKDLTDDVNSMAANLTDQVRNIAEVSTAIAHGDLSRKITAEARGEILELKNTINTMVDQLGAFASEVTRVAREVGTDGRLGGQAEVRGVSGTWRDLTESVNRMAANLTDQVRNIAEVSTAIAHGDLSRKITAEARGEIAELKDTINTMVDQLNAFASEVTRVAREVGTEGRLGGQAEVQGVSGTWRALTESVNSMAANLTDQVRNIAEVSTAIAYGDLSRKITVNVRGEIAELKETINTMVDQLNAFASEVTRVAREVGTEGRLGGQAEVQGVSGTWRALTESVNRMAANLTDQVRNIAEVSTAIAHGDLSRKITVEARGEIQELKRTINTMVDQLNAFASEVTRVAREVGTEGKLGGQADVQGVSGTWKDLTDNVNSMATNLTDQVRNIARVVTAVANGELRQKLVLEAKGEIAELADTINSMTDTLATFAEQVTTVAREVGAEGKLGGQAQVPGAAGTWRDLTDNVNFLAANLTTQVRAIAEVATAVTNGDLTRNITVEAAGEVASLKDNINEMIRNLRDTTRINTEQDWLKTHVARFTQMMQGQRDLLTVARLILSELAPLVGEQHGVFYYKDGVGAAGSAGNGSDEGGNEAPGSEPSLRLLASYGYRERKHLNNRFLPGEGLVGQCMLEKQPILLTDVPDDYIKITSGLGEATPRNIAVLPVLFEDEVLAVLEIASLQRFSDIQLTMLEQLTGSLGIVLNTLAASQRTEDLLRESQRLTDELRKRQDELQETNAQLEQQAASLQASEELLRQQQEELQQTNEELEEKAQLLSEQNREVERKNQQIELARQELEEKAEQLSLTSRYKSEFLANMSHELRTPLNSMLILSRLLAENGEGNLTTKQVEYASTIHSSGNDLLALINEILDLAKIESGTMEVHVGSVAFDEVRAQLERTFNEIAQEKGLRFDVALSEDLPKALRTDGQRLQQVLRNLLSNAFKFTETGRVALEMRTATGGWRRDVETLNRAGMVVAFSVADTGIGIPEHRQKLVFEAFQQGDGTTSRKYGGTGLGLSISREIAHLLGGDITLKSVPGEGSTFTLFLPVDYTPGERPDAVTRAAQSATFSGEPPSAALGGAPDAAAAETAAAASEAVPEPAALHTAPEAEMAAALMMPADVSDDRSEIQAGDQVLLIVEDDVSFARILLDRAREKGFKGIVAARGESVVPLAHRFQPDAITLDIRLPDMDGWAVLDRLKHDPNTRHIPVHIISATDEPLRGLKQGALAYLAKPVTREALDEALGAIKGFLERKVKRLLVVEDDEVQRGSIVDLIGNNDVKTSAVASGKEALEALKSESFDCMVLDLGLPDMSGRQLIETIRKELGQTDLPIIVYTGKELTKKQETELRRLADTIIVKDVNSPERLLDETTLFLHRVQANLPSSKRQMLEKVRLDDPTLAGKKALIVDDDIRNIFALTSLLEQHQMQTVYAENGRDALEVLGSTPDIDIVLMDVMMPEMDGYETMRAIREQKKFRNLPIIALTAKAMKGDRENCIQAGASDYIAKPVDTEQMLSLLRVWLYR